MDWVRDNKLDEEVYFITGLTGNSVLNKRCEDWVKSAQNQFKYNKVPIKFYKSFTYQAGSWKYAQRVIVKIEITAMGTNIRYIVTNFRHGNSRFLYEEVYCGRGQMELYIKELKTYLDANRTSCHAFKANGSTGSPTVNSGYIYMPPHTFCCTD
jgi:hypothetical protein